MKKRNKLVELIQRRLKSRQFINSHKSHPRDFTRMSPLSFSTVFLTILRKSVKSLQNVLNELYLSKDIKRVVTSSAYSQARKKLKHTAFIALNEDTIRTYYEDNCIKLWKGYRVFGVDGSKIMLPNEQALHNEYGSVTIKNQTVEDSYSCALFECRYDVLNKIVVQSALLPGNTYEVEAAIGLLRESTSVIQEAKDLDIYDRGYASYEFLANLTQHNREFVIRCPRNSFKTASEFFKATTGKEWSRVVTIKAPKDVLNKMREQGLPTEITVRFVRVVLNTGEIEVLVTSLIEHSINKKEFKALYFLRWGVEGFFSCIKGRLDLENFTGKSVESVQQDFWSTLFITNVETVFIEETEAELNQQKMPSNLPVKINKSVSFNIIKNMAFDIFYGGEEQSVINERLTELFRTNTLVQRVNRTAPRKKTSLRASLSFQKKKKKHVF